MGSTHAQRLVVQKLMQVSPIYSHNSTCQAPGTVSNVGDVAVNETDKDLSPNGADILGGSTSWQHMQTQHKHTMAHT